MKRWHVVVVGLGLASASWAQETELVSIGSGGAQENRSSEYPCISSDGRFVAFTSFSSNMGGGDHNYSPDVFVRDRYLGTTEWESHAYNGSPANGGCYVFSISADGRYVVFGTLASNIVPSDTNGFQDVFVHDRQAGTTELVSISTGGIQGNDNSAFGSISADGRYVAFESSASNLVAGDTNHVYDVFVRDRQNGTTERVDVATGGAEANNGGSNPVISADGRLVAFISNATTLTPIALNGYLNVFVRDRQFDITELISVSTGGAGGNDGSFIFSVPAISADGRYVAFQSLATDLVVGDTNGFADVFVRDRQSGTTERVSIDSGGLQGNNNSGLHLAMSGDGLWVAFQSDATNLVPNDTNGWGDTFVRDRQTGTTLLVSIATSGMQANNGAGEPAVSFDGRYVAFVSIASNLVLDDTNGYQDVFLRDRDATSFTSLCEPGTGSVIDCPCSNWPTYADRGCDNSAFTGGAGLLGSGLAHLSTDSLVLTTSGEKPTAFSIVLQGGTFLPNGVVYGQGVRCAGVPLLRLYTKHAIAGSITAPDFSAGDPTVSAQSAAKGDVIQPGQSRWYLVFYRDPVVLGGCPATSTFNATQTGQVTWWP